MPAIVGVGGGSKTGGAALRASRSPPTRAILGSSAATDAAVGLIATASVIDPLPLLVWNASASAPVGLYLLRPQASFSRGDMALIDPPPAVARLAAERGYLPSGVPLVKRIAAASGETVCAVGSVIFIDGKPVAERLATDALGRPLPVWQGCRILDIGEVFPLMASSSDSFDGRYFGPVTASRVPGRLVLLWTD